MLNKEKYAKEIIEAVVNSGGKGAGLKDGKPFPCSDMKCDKCGFSGRAIGCEAVFVEWANSEYVESTVDWSKVPVDTPILVRGTNSEDWLRRHFAKFNHGQVYAWHDGRTSWSSNTMTPWIHAKLAEGEEDI